MKIAVIGAGFSGLSVCYHLLQCPEIKVSLFDEKGIGGGASGVSSGLLYPYPGINGSPSWNAMICLNETKKLIETVQNFSKESLADYTGILRYATSEEQSQKLSKHSDVEKIKDHLFLVRSGATVFTNRYLQALWKACETLGAELTIHKISSLDELKEYNGIVLANGWGIKEFIDTKRLQINFTKGQKLFCENFIPKISQSKVARGYIALSGDSQFFEIGSTYERDFSSPLPHLETAKDLLTAQIQFFCPEVKILESKAGVRVSKTSHYLPIVEKIHKNCYLLSGMGSRGLLYHAYFGKRVAQTLLCELKSF